MVLKFELGSNTFIANMKQGVGPQFFPMSVTAVLLVRFESLSMTIYYQNLCYNEVC